MPPRIKHFPVPTSLRRVVGRAGGWWTRSRPSTVALGLLMVLACGCQVAGPQVTEDTPPSEGLQATEDSRSREGLQPTEDLDLQPTEDLDLQATEDLEDGVPPEATSGPPECEDAEVTAIDEVIGGQLDAFVARDFEQALEFATSGFRQSFSPEAFGAMITRDFPIPATARSHEILDCASVDDTAIVTVVIVGDGGEQSYQYGLVNLPEGWRIDGAVPTGNPTNDAEII